MYLIVQEMWLLSINATQFTNNPHFPCIESINLAVTIELQFINFLKIPLIFQDCSLGTDNTRLQRTRESRHRCRGTFSLYMYMVLPEFSHGTIVPRKHVELSGSGTTV